jgi:membrane-associated phospholipid phosphatase
MAIVVPSDPLAIDRWWSEVMLDVESPLLKDLALAFNALGRGLAWALSLAAVGVALLVARRWLALVAVALAESPTSLRSALLKAAVGRPRPPDGLVYPVGSSFPSGHAAYAGATCVALVLLTRWGAGRRWWWALAALAIVGMAWSRTYLQVHWLSDVVGGSPLGIGIALVVLAGAQCGAKGDAASAICSNACLFDRDLPDRSSGCRRSSVVILAARRLPTRGDAREREPDSAVHRDVR